MKNIKIQLIKQKERMQNIIEQRQDYVLNRSEKWQESEKCENYEDKTQEFEIVLDGLDSVIDELTEILER